MVSKNNEIKNFSLERKHINSFPYKENGHFNTIRNEGQPKQEQTSKFHYGNYHQYYGYRNQGMVDSRLLCMKQEWFSGKNVLDIGCNAGHFTLSIAKDFSPHLIIGIDIDTDLIKMAMKNVRHYINNKNISDDDFPISLVLNYGPLAQGADPKGKYAKRNFPFNIQFIQANYILSSNELINYQQPYFDTILCLSLTKWIHLNWGDEGIKKLFNRIYQHLNPGGILILEAQNFASYSKRKKITEIASKFYNEIKLKPECFNEYLLNEVGFVSCQLIDIPAHTSQGFCRPIYLFTKSQEISKNICHYPKHTIYKISSNTSSEDPDVAELSE